MPDPTKPTEYIIQNLRLELQSLQGQESEYQNFMQHQKELESKAEILRDEKYDLERLRRDNLSKNEKLVNGMKSRLGVTVKMTEDREKELQELV
jgi:hypothetical protein